jgi:aryl-alcohol dehydrogenase-like predicted oxidoreductase
MEACPHCGDRRAPRTVAIRWTVLAVACLAALGLAFVLGGDLLRLFLEGMQRSRLPWWQAIVPVLGIGLVWWLALRRFEVVACRNCAPAFPWRSVAAPALPVERRTVLLRLAGLGVAMGLAPLAALLRAREWIPVFGKVILAPAPTRAGRVDAAWAGARVAATRRLGRTGAMVSDISFGCTRLDDARVARLAIDRGINYFDTSPDYASHGAERALGEAIRGRRDEVVIATKFCGADGHLPEETPVADILASVEGSLRRLGTDHVDVIQVHSCNRVERLLAPNVHEAFDRLREQGKARFLGVSSHAPNLAEVANAAIDSGRFDMIMLAYHFGMWPSYAELLDRAHRHDVGIVAMKTLKGAKHAQLPELTSATASYPQAAFRWVLSNPAVSCLVVSMWEAPQLDEYLYASGTAPREDDVALLQRYDGLVAGDYCQPHCGACRTVCPADVPIDDMLRARMYHLDYGWKGEGERVFGPLQGAAANCIGCAAPCARVCPQGIDIPLKLADTAVRLGRGV